MGSTGSHKQINYFDAIFSLDRNVAAHATYNSGSAGKPQGGI